MVNKMWTLIRIQAFNYLRYLIPLSVFLIFYFTEFYEGGKLPVFVFLCFWAFLLISGSLSTSESYEEKNKGYRIMGALPVTDREIVFSKFILVFGAALFVTVLNVSLLLVRMDTVEGFPMKLMVGVLWGIFCLHYGGVMYIGIFKLGYTRMTKYFWTAFLIILVAMVFFVGDVLTGLKINPENLKRIADGGLWIPAAILGIVFYYFMYRYAVRVKEASEEI